MGKTDAEGANGPGAARRIDPGLPRFRAPGEPNVGRGGALRTYEIGEERAPSTPAIPGSGKVSIIPLDVPDREAHGVTPSPTPCGWSHTGPASSGSVPSAYCVTSWSSSVGYPGVIPFFLLWCWLACGAGSCCGVLWEDKERGDYSPTFVEGGFSEGSPSRQASIISGEAGGIFERLEESAGSLSM